MKHLKTFKENNKSNEYHQFDDGDFLYEIKFVHMECLEHYENVTNAFSNIWKITIGGYQSDEYSVFLKGTIDDIKDNLENAAMNEVLESDFDDKNLILKTQFPSINQEEDYNDPEKFGDAADFEED